MMSGSFPTASAATLAMVLDLDAAAFAGQSQLTTRPQRRRAVVLIDEIDLHLHPKWQRQIVHNLTAAFPRCQFIATTHSPQVIGEVEHDRIQIIADGQVYSPTHSFGVDSSRVLEEIMDLGPADKGGRGPALGGLAVRSANSSSSARASCSHSSSSSSEKTIPR